MTDGPYGLGAIESPPDPRDYGLPELAAAAGAPVASPPPSYIAPALPPILDQGSSPMCVAYSSASLKAQEDRLDQGSFFTFDEPMFFRAIGGTQYGAIPRNALDRMLRVGYPLAAGGGADQHRIAAYYRIPITRAALESTIASYGPLLISTPWYHSWFSPVGVPGSRVLPSADYPAGRHLILAPGYNSVGLILRNSWGIGWGDRGSVVMPWSIALYAPSEAWRALDVIEAPQPGPLRFRIAHGPYTTYRVIGGRARVSGHVTYRSNLVVVGELVRAIQSDGSGTTTLLRILSGAHHGTLLYRFAPGIVPA